MSVADKDSGFNEWMIELDKVENNTVQAFLKSQ